MIPYRRRPLKTRVLHSAYVDQVPPVISSYVDVMIAQALQATDESMQEHTIRRITHGITIEHVPTREVFEKAFVSKRAAPAEIKICSETDRIYIVGVGLPGREELTTERVPHVNPFTKVMEGTEIITMGSIKEDTILTYTEVSWREYREATDLVNNFHPMVRQGLAKYFQMPEHYTVGIVLATPSMTEENYHEIASYALNPRTG